MHVRWRTAVDIAAVLAAILSVVLVGGRWWRNATGAPAVAALDFSHFYALGHAAAHVADREALVDDGAWRDLIGRIVPGHDHYPRVYGPQTAVWFAPLSLVPLPAAYIAWSSLSFALFGLCVAGLVVRFRPELARHHFLIVTGTVAFPALAHLLMAGHATVLAVAGLTVAVTGLARRSRVTTGVGIGLLSFKPTLFLPVVAVAFLGGEVVACLVAGTVAVALLLVTVPLLGFAPLEAYVVALLNLSQNPDIVAKPSIMASLRTLAYQLVPEAVAGPTYVAAAVVVILAAVWAWRRTDDPLERVAIAAVATVLASPHVYNYDLVIALPAFVVSAAWAVNRRPGWKLVGVAAVAAYAAPIVPIAVASVPVSATAITHLWWFFLIAWTVGADTAVREHCVRARESNPSAGLPTASNAPGRFGRPRTSVL